MIKNFLRRIGNVMNFSVAIGGLGDIFELWQKGDAKERAIIAVVFAPTFLCAGGLLFSIVSFVLFVLPSFVFRFLGWLLLTVLFAMGGKYGYERLTGHKRPSSFSASSSNHNDSGSSSDAAYTDVPFVEEPQGQSSRREEIRRKWFERVRRDH